MREIKFRAWHKPSGKMFDVIELSPFGASKLTGKGRTEGICLQCEGACYSPFVFEVDCEVMQYTGLKDTHGVEIYEGDIMGGIVGCAVSWIGKDARWGFDYEGEVDEITFRELEQSELIVIGNIYENPELLSK